LQERGIKATFYVNTARTNTPGFMNVSELKALQNYGHEIGSHSNNHVSSTSLTDSELRQELSISKGQLIGWALTNNDGTLNFAYPNGLRTDYTDSIVA
jgi:peptidoglycan/xylan/chitin deacetylase (PgdA/CDA1 family)